MYRKAVAALLLHSRIRRRFAVLITLTATWSILGSAAEERSFFVPVYPTAGSSIPAGATFSVTSPGLQLQVAESNALRGPRPILLLIDPGSYEGEVLRRRVADVARAVVRASEGRIGPIVFRLGIPVLDGVLSEPFSVSDNLNQALERTLESYLPEGSQTDDSHFVRTLDLLAGIIQKAEAEGGPVDCLLVARDRRIVGDHSDYIGLSIVRQFVDVTARRGSVLYGYLSGSAILEKACIATGGLTFSDREPAEGVIQAILQSWEAGYLLKVVHGEMPRSGTRFPLTVELRTRTGERLPLRKSSAIWLHPNSNPVPDQYHVGQGLDWLRRAQEAEKDANLTLAARFIENSIQEDPWNAEAFHFAAEVARADNQISAAGSYSAQALSLGSREEKTLILYASVFEKLGKAATALEVLESSLKSGVAVTPPLKLQFARLLRATGRDEEAANLYSELIDSEDSDTTHAELAGILWRRGDGPRALEHLEVALQRNPRNMTALISSCEIAVAQGRLADAQAFAQRSLQVDPRNADAQAAMANVQGADGKWEQAVGYYRAAWALAPGRWDILRMLVDALVEYGKPSEAEDLLRRHVETHPSDVDAYSRLARVQLSTGGLSDAVSTLEGASAHAPQRAHVLFREAAELRERRGEYGQALLNYRAMLLSSPPDLARSRRNDLSHHLSYLTLVLKKKDRVTVSDQPVTDAGAENPTLPAGGMAPVTSDKPGHNMNVPGGLPLLARTLGVDPAMLNEPDATERIFSFMMEISSSHPEKVQDNPLRRDVVSYLRHYDSLMKHMKKHGFLGAGFNPAQGEEFRLSLEEEGEAFKRTQRFLSFFGIGVKKKRSGDGSVNVTLSMKQSRTAMERQTLLRNMGVNLLDRNLREIRFSLKDDSLPVLLGEETWTKGILGSDKNKSWPLLGRLVLNHRAMRLYLALAGCADSTREGLLGAVTGGELLELSDVLGLYGRYLEFRNGKLWLPGSPKAWEGPVGAPVSEPSKFISAMLRRDAGRPLLLYYALSVASEPVQHLLTKPEKRLTDLYRTLSDYYRMRLHKGTSAIAGRDVGSLLRQLSADDQRLWLDIDQRFAKYVLPSVNIGSSPGGPSRVPVDVVEALLETGDSPGSSSLLPVVSLLEFIRYIQWAYSEALDDEAIEALMRSPVQTRVLLDLIWDIRPPPSLLIRYLTYCRELAQAGSRGWSINRTRTSQSLFHLISLMHRQGALSQDEARTLLASLLQRLATEDEAVFAFRVAEFLSGEMLPALRISTGSKASSEIILRALAGAGDGHEFSFEGKSLRFDPASYKLQRMSATVMQQRYTPLERLLEIFRHLRSSSEESREKPHPSVAALREGMKALKGVESEPGSSPAPKDAVAQIDLPALIQKLEASQTKGGRAISPQLAAEIASALHLELGVTLLTYCYAYHGSPETDALAFDPNFIRKHVFSVENQGKQAGWRPARLEQKEWVGAHIAGSISSLGFELTSLETAQTVQSFGKREGKTLVPTLVSGFRAMRRAMLSDRAQEYVALSVRMGREALALTGVDPRAGSWIEGVLRSMIPPRRRERVSRLLEERNAGRAAEILAPSELFLIGESYREYHTSAAALPTGVAAEAMAGNGGGDSAGSGGERSGANGNGASHAGSSTDVTAESLCPVMQRLEEIAPESGTPEEKNFRREVQEYGVLLRRRIGLNELSMSISDSYEQLETGAPEEVVYERICDLKIRMAELNHSLGLPAFLGEVAGELAVRDILPRDASVRTNNWKLALEQIGRLDIENARNWVEQMLNRGILSIANGEEAAK